MMVVLVRFMKNVDINGRIRNVWVVGLYCFVMVVMLVMVVGVVLRVKLVKFVLSMVVL